MPLLRVICWAIIFLTRIRFLPGISIADNYMCQYSTYIGHRHRVSIRQYKMILNKVNKIIQNEFMEYQLNVFKTNNFNIPITSQ